MQLAAAEPGNDMLCPSRPVWFLHVAKAKLTQERHNNTARVKWGHGGHLLYDDYSQKLRGVVTVEHVGLAFMVELGEDFAGCCFELLEFGDFVKV